MSTRLIQVVPSGALADGASVVVPHAININGTPKKPDFVALDAAGFSVTVTATTATITNNSGVAGSVNVWLELKHSIPRELGGLTNLTPQPFVAATGAAGGGGSLTSGASYVEDFISVANIATSVAGGGSVVNNDTPLPTMVGLVRLNGGVGGSACVFPNSDPANVGFANAIFNFDSGKFTCEWRARWLGPIPAGGSDAQAFIGAHDLPILGGSNGVPSDGALFQAGFALNGNANWWARVLGNGDQAVDTGIAVDGNPIRLKAVAEFGVDTKFYINDALVATILNATANTDGFDLTVAADGQGISTLVNIALDYFTIDREVAR